jgi:putative DNA primase/helicase
MAEIPAVFDQPGARFVLLPAGVKFPPIEKAWQEKPHSLKEAAEHAAKGGNVGILAGNEYIGFDQDAPEAFEGLELPTTCRWETRPGRYGLWFKASDVAEALDGIGKKPDLAQIRLFRNGKPCGEIKLQRTYQVIPASWKTLEDGTRADYKMLDSSPPATITLAGLLADLQAIGISFSSKLESNAARLEKIGTKARQRRTESDEQRTRRYALAALHDEAFTLAGSPTGSRNEALNKAAFSLAQFTKAGLLSESEITRELTRAAMNVGLEAGEIRATIMSGLEAGAKHPREIPERSRPIGGNGPISGLRGASEEISIREQPTDGGNAQRLIRLHHNNIKHCHTFKKWMVWDGNRWKIDGDGSAYRFCDDVIREIYSEASESMDSKDRQEWAKFAIRSDSGRGYRDMLFLASFNKAIAITSEQLDTNPWLLNTANLTVDLKTFEVREPRREDLITKTTGTRYDTRARCDLWTAFLEKIFGGDQELIKYVQRAAGYSLTGSMAEQVYFFCHGTGANGKSVFLATLRALLGDYARQASFDTFLVQHTAKVRNDLAALAGARVITASEAEEGSRLSMQVIKSWTGGDPITARFLFGEDFTFAPEGKVWLAANTRPIISERNYAAWRRVHLIPFSVTIPLEEQDRELESKLLEELPGILIWALRGLEEYHRIGLQPPEAVKAATDAYRRENDSLTAFISECCEVQKLAICKNSDLFREYLNFCGMDGYEPISQMKFSMELSSLAGVRKTRDRSLGVIWHGVQLSKNWSDPVKANQHQAQSVKAVKPNPQSFENSLHEANFSETPSQPSQPAHDSDSEKSNPSRPGESDGAAQPGDSSERIRVAALMEFGINGQVDPGKVAGKLHMPREDVEAWLEVNYTRLESSPGVVRYTQRRSDG